MPLASPSAAPVSGMPHAPATDWRDYLALMKPRVMSLAVFTSLVGLVLAPGALHPVLALAALLLIAAGAGAAGALNMWYEADLDAKMARTATRPVAAGRMTPAAALEFGAVVACASVYCLGVMISWAAAAWLAFTIFFYAVVYTMWLKPRTVHNIALGGLAGALPPVIGWAAGGGGWDWLPALLCLHIALWTPPHFWALALLCRDEYAAADVPMLPVARGTAVTQRQILLYTVATVGIGCLPFALGMVGVLGGAAAGLGGAALLVLGWQLWRSGEAFERAARRMFFGSIYYLFALYAAWLADALLFASGGGA